MSVQLFAAANYRTGMFRYNQFRNGQESDHHDLWHCILKAYRRYRALGIDRDSANLLTMGYADGRRHGPVLTTMHKSEGAS